MEEKDGLVELSVFQAPERGTPREEAAVGIIMAMVEGFLKARSSAMYRKDSPSSPLAQLLVANVAAEFIDKFNKPKQ